MTTILVTGANGFVGSHIIEALNQNNDIKVVAACRDKSKLIPSFRGEVREGDIRDISYVRELLKDIDVVCNAFAWTSAWSNKKNSRRLYLEPTLTFVDAVLQSDVKRFINISTTSAASPDSSSDPMSAGIERSLWPHLCNVVKIENYLRANSDKDCTMVNLRIGLFTGSRYGLGLLPMLLPRLKTHLVPWVNRGKTSMPIIDGKDIGQAFSLASTAQGLNGYESFNIVGPTIPTAREVITYFHDEFGYPKPHFSVPFFIAYPFGWFMEKLDPLVPWDPLVTRSIVHLLEETNADNDKAEKILGYKPKIHWKDSIQLQVAEMANRSRMKMYKPITP